MRKVQWYHAGCSVCVAAEDAVVDALDKTKFDVEKVDVGAHPQRLADAEAAGVKTLPALVIGGVPFHINFGASVADLKA